MMTRQKIKACRWSQSDKASNSKIAMNIWSWAMKISSNMKNNTLIRNNNKKSQKINTLKMMSSISNSSL